MKDKNASIILSDFIVRNILSIGEAKMKESDYSNVGLLA